MSAKTFRSESVNLFPMEQTVTQGPNNKLPKSPNTLKEFCWIETPEITSSLCILL